MFYFRFECVVVVIIASNLSLGKLHHI